MVQDKSLDVMVFQFCFYLTLLSNLIIYIAQPLNLILFETLASRCFMLCNLVSFFFVVNKSIKHTIPYMTSQIITIAFMICFSFISYLLSSTSGMYNYIIRMWCYLALPFYFLFIDYLKPNKKMINFIFIINFLITIVFAFLSFSNYRYAGYENFLGTDSAWLTLGYDNPNQTAMYLMITLIILYCALNYYTNIIIRIFILFDIIYMGLLLIDTSSRTCILIGLIITVLILFKKKKKYTVSRYIVIGILLLPVIFLFVYPFFYENGIIYFLKFLGKADYSSRSYIFLSVLKAIKDRLWFGDFGVYQLQNIHNGTLSVLSSLGIIGFLFFYIYYFKAYLNILANGIKSKTAYISFIGLLAIFIHACTEGAFLVGGSMYAGTLSVLIFLVKLDRKDANNN